MSVGTFIPEVWDANVIVGLEKNLVLADPGVTVNTDYEGDIANYGDTVHINMLVDPIIRDYVPNETVINPDNLTTLEQLLTIDQCKYYAIEIDDVDKRQAMGDLLTKSASRAAYQMRVVVDTYVGTRMVEGAGTILDPTTVSSSDVDELYGLIVDIKTAFDDKDIPDMDRWIAGSPSLVNSFAWDTRFTAANEYGSNELITNGEIGNVLGFRIKKSTHMPTGATVASNFLVAGQGNQGCSFAQQISKTEAYRPQNSFSDAIKGLQLYGAKVIRPEFLLACDVTVNS